MVKLGSKICLARPFKSLGEFMSNNTSFYLGAFLEIKVSEQEVIENFFSCENGHKNACGNFCGECGSEVSEKSHASKAFPSSLYGLIEENFEDDLHDLTPQGIFGKGTIIAKSNECIGEWLQLDEEGDIEMKEFPSESEIHDLKVDLSLKHRDVIEFLEGLDSVVSVEVKAGYVIDAEY